MTFFVGIDPGLTGGIGIIDRAGGFIAAHRWNKKAPARLFDLILSIRGEIDNYIYLELVQTFPQMASGFQNLNQGLLVNLGIWQGFLMAARVEFELISPRLWQNAHNLTAWQKKQAAGLPQPSPLDLARLIWPAAPLEFLADDGKAVALLLADLSRRDFLAGLDRRPARVARQLKEKARRQKRRQAQKEQPQPFTASPAHPDRSIFDDLPSTGPGIGKNILAPSRALKRFSTG